MLSGIFVLGWFKQTEDARKGNNLDKKINVYIWFLLQYLVSLLPKSSSSHVDIYQPNLLLKLDVTFDDLVKFGTRLILEVVSSRQSHGVSFIQWLEQSALLASRPSYLLMFTQNV